MKTPFLSVPGIVGVALLCLVPQSVAETADEGRRLVYLSNRAGVSRSFDLFLVELSSLSERNITEPFPGLGLTSISAPKLLRKRNSVVCFAAGGRTLVEIPLGQGAVRTVAKVAQASAHLSVSPDEQTLLYSDRVGEKLQVMEADIERCTIRNLSSNSWNESEPSYSRDGRLITYVTDRDGSLSIALMGREGRGEKVLTNNFGSDRFPRFSPGGDRIVFSSSRSARNDGQNDLYTIDTSGRNFNLLYSNGAFNTSPVFSPDGKELAFVSANLTKKVSHVLLLDLASGAVTNLTLRLPLFNQNASFSDDGQVIVFEGNTVRDCDVMMYDKKSGSVQNLSRHPAWDCSPSF